MADKAISFEQFKEALKAIRNSTISEPDLSVRFVENAPNLNAAEGEPGYIQGRTHWTELAMVDIFKDLEVSELEEGAGQGMLPGTYDIEAGKQYIVTYNGTEFRCTSAYFGEEGVNMAVVIGNVGALTGTGDSGEPFILMFVLPEFIEAIGVASAIMFLDGSSSAVISLSSETETVHKLPQKYYDATDWEAVNGEPGHMLNKPFGEDGIIVLAESSLVFSNIDGFGIACNGTLSKPLEADKYYRVDYNGVRYRTQALMLGDNVAIGNIAVAGFPNDNGLPFLLSNTYNGNSFLLIQSNAQIGDTAVIKIATSDRKLIPTEYMPASVNAIPIIDLSDFLDEDGNNIRLSIGGATTTYRLDNWLNEDERKEVYGALHNGFLFIKGIETITASGTTYKELAMCRCVDIMDTSAEGKKIYYTKNAHEFTYVSKVGKKESIEYQIKVVFAIHTSSNIPNIVANFEAIKENFVL